MTDIANDKHFCTRLFLDTYDKRKLRLDIALSTLPRLVDANKRQIIKEQFNT